MYRKHELLENKLCKELDLLEEKYRTGAEMSEGDLRRIDLLTHAIKSLATYSAMKEAEEARSYMSHDRGYETDMSYGNRNMDRFVSRDNYHPLGNMQPYYPQDRRW